MSDQELLDRAERAARGMALPDGRLDDLLRRRDRQRLNQRIAAGVVGLAVFVTAVWIGTTGGPFDRTQTPATPGATAVTGPSVPPDPDGRRSIGVPPEGADPSSPERGELVITFYGRPLGAGFHPPVLQVLVYADGRVIWREEGGPYGTNGIQSGFLEQRLTPEGVELLRSEVISSGLFDRNHHFDEGEGFASWGEIRVDDGNRFMSVRWGNATGEPTSPTTPEQVTALRRLSDLFSDLASMLPASAWEDQEIKVYVPSRYAICYLQNGRPLEPSEVLNRLPTPAEDLLLGRDRTYEPEPDEGRGWRVGCSEVTIEEARLLDEVLGDAGFARGDYSGVLEYLEYDVPSYTLRFEPILPHGQWSLFPG